MAEVHVDFMELTDFQNVLKQNIFRIEEMDSKTKSTLEQYEWNDKVAETFKGNFRLGMQPINALKNEMDQMIPWLQKKIIALQDYHGS